MPIPASDAIASDVGHGVLGLRDNLRPLSELFGESAGQRHIWCQARPIQFFFIWVEYDLAGTYQTDATNSFDGVTKDIIGAKTPTEILVRVETEALCQATEGSYYFDPIAETGLFLVHLTGDQDPNGTAVVTQFGFYFGSHGVFQPTLGPNKLTDGGLEIWSSSSNLTNWSETFSGGTGSIARDQTTVIQGTSSARLGNTSLTGGHGVGVMAAFVTGVLGKLYRVSGYYRTARTNPVGIEARLRIGMANSWLLVDGSGTTANITGFALARTEDEWRRFVFDFVCPASTSSLEVMALAHNSTGGALTGQVWFDGLSLQRIWRFEYYEPRLGLDDVPTVEASRADIYFGPVNVSLGSVTLQNANAYMETLFGMYQWLGQEIVVLAGGRFPHGGNEVLLDDVTTLLVGYIRSPEIEDGRALLQLQDVKTLLNTRLPDHYYEANGRPKPRLFGTKRNITPYRVDTTPPSGLNDYGVWELNDPDRAPNLAAVYSGPAVIGTRIVTIDAADSWVYTDKAAADIEDPTKRVLLKATHLDDSTGHFWIVRNPGPFEIIAGENDRIDFINNSVTRVGALTPGMYDDTTLTVHIESVMTTAAGATVQVIPWAADHPTNAALNYKVEMTYSGAGNFQLLVGSGANKQRSIYRTLGFTGSADLTGATVYNADTELPRNPDSWVIRIKAEGYQDDAAGTFTGTANALITKAPDVLRCVLQRFVAAPIKIDLPSFVAARATSSVPLAVYLGHLQGGTASDTSIELSEFIENIENGAGADIILNGDTFFYRERDTSVPADIIDLYDRDYLSFRGILDDTDYYQFVIIAWNQNPTTGEETLSQASEGLFPIKFGRTKQRTFRTYLSSDFDVDARMGGLTPQAWGKVRRFAFEVKGKALGRRVGEKLRLNRRKGLTAGSLTFSPVTVRICSKVDDYPGWVSGIVCAEGG